MPCVTGSLNDAGVFNSCDLKRGLENGQIRIPAPNLLPNSDRQSPYFFVGDAGFPLLSFLMTPFA